MPGSRQLSDEALLEALDYVLQKHTQASKGGRSHADFRFGNVAEGLESYALPKGHLPGVKERVLAVGTEIHPHGYMHFQGQYGHGTGKNKVEILESGKINAKGSPDGARLLEIEEEGPKRRFKLVKMDKGGKENWILVGLPPKTASDKPYKIVSGRFIDCRTGKPLANLCIFKCLTAKSLQKGLGGRTDLPSGLGMLFLNCNSFWMKDVPFDLDLVRLDKDFNVTEITRMPGSFHNLYLPTYRARKRASEHAIELPAGYCEAKGVKVGDKLEIGKAKA